MACAAGAAPAGPASANPAAPLPSWVVTNSLPATNTIVFDEFLGEVAAANLDYAAQRYNVDIAKAAVAIAKEFPNPTLNLNGSKDVRYWNRKLPDSSGRLVSQSMAEPAGVGIDQAIEYFGKRKWRIRAAGHAYRAAAATLEDFLRNLKLDASEAFVEALATEQTLEQERKAADYLAQLVVAQRHRLAAGDIGETDLTQSRVDELQLQNDLLNAQNDAQTAQLALSAFLGRDRGQTTLIPRGKLDSEPRVFDLSRLIFQALQNRSDLVALRHARDGADSGIHLAKASRVPDVDVGLSYTYTSGSDNFVAPAQPDSMVGLSLSVPLPLWNRQRAEIATAKFNARQAEAMLQSAELKAEVNVRQTFSSYEIMQQRVRKFQGELLKGAEEVLAAKRFSYEHGQATLLELLDAQRADNDVHQSYNDALADAAKALIELERAAGLWDVRF
jgi:cobalt-zinc-cadmium efflux system outer membrane protein